MSGIIEFRNSNSRDDLLRVFNFTRIVDVFYPEFAPWYWNKVTPDIVAGNGTIVLAEQYDEIVGAALVKDGVEKKIRCLRIEPRLVGRGLGLNLIDRSLRILGEDKPAVSAPEEKINEYSRIFINRYGFDLKRVEKNHYRKQKLEYFFNSEP